jgi:hypothetical protein
MRNYFFSPFSKASLVMDLQIWNLVYIHFSNKRLANPLSFHGKFGIAWTRPPLTDSPSAPIYFCECFAMINSNLSSIDQSSSFFLKKWENMLHDACIVLQTIRWRNIICEYLARNTIPWGTYLLLKKGKR